jgi:anti-sigma factor RsiW
MSSSSDPIPLVTDQDLHAFVDGELDGRRYRKVVARLATDPVAAERVNGFLRQHGELVGLRERLADIDPLADARTAELTRELAGALRHQQRVRLGVASSGIAAVVLAGLWGLWGPDPGRVAERLAWTRDLVDSGPQVLFGRDPFGGTPQLAAGGDGPMLPLDEQLAAYSIRRPDLGAHGLAFVGGDALQGGDSPSVRLVYEDEEGRRVFLFVGAVGSDADVALTLVPEGHISLNWRRGPMVFALIGPKESEQLLEVMAATSEFLAPATGEGSATAADAVAAGAAAAAPGAVAASPGVESLPDPAAKPPVAEGVTAITGPAEVIGSEGQPLPVTPAVAEDMPKPL